MSELVVKACWCSIFKDDLSSDCNFFYSIKDEWDKIDTSSNLDIITLDKDIQDREEALEFFMELLSKRNKRNEMAI